MEMKDFVQYFFSQAAKVDFFKSVQEETHRYSSAPKHATQSEKKFLQWTLLNMASRWTWLPRLKHMTRDKFED